jgi:hypothetical protein
VVGHNVKDGYLLDSCAKHCGSWSSVRSEEGMTQQVKEGGREGGRGGWWKEGGGFGGWGGHKRGLGGRWDREGEIAQGNTGYDWRCPV